MGQYAGKYNRVITIKSPAETQASTGDRSISWTTVVTDLPCYIKPNGGSEVFTEAQRVASNTIIFGIRYPHDYSINETMQLDFEGSTFNISNAYENISVGRRVELLITATKKDNS